jgi:hypothetical protein
MAIGQKTVVSNPHEPAGKYMGQEPPDEFPSIERSQLGTVPVTSVAVSKRDLAGLHLDQPVVAVGNAMRVATQVIQ